MPLLVQTEYLIRTFLVNIANAAMSVSDAHTYTSVDFLNTTSHRGPLCKDYILTFSTQIGIIGVQFWEVFKFLPSSPTYMLELIRE